MKNKTFHSISEGDAVPQMWNETAVTYPLHKVLHQLFEEQVKRTPDQIALIFRNEQLTYSQVNTYANQLAHYLKAHNVRRESIVGVCFERSFEMVISLLAVMKAGGAYLPLDPEYPDERRSFMIKDSNLSLILTHSQCKSKIPSANSVFIYNKNDSSLAAFSGADNAESSNPDNAAYVIYTSGSTGTPKGVINTHQGIVNRLLWMQDCFSLTAQDRVLQKTPYSFDVSVWEFFWPLITGAQLVIAEPGGHRDADYLVKTIKENIITTIHFVPSMLRMFLEAEGIEKLSCLNRVICSGEALPYVLQEKFFQRVSASLFNLYGPTEAAVDVTWWECHRNDERKIVPIGRPISNIQIHILDEQMKQVPVGTPGELYIGGIGVAREYLNRPELTKERFIKDPFSNIPGARLYKTGDLCKYLTDGAIEYIGRIDNQVKIRGFRVELGEIETAILQYDSIRAAAVVVKGDAASGDTRLIAYLVSSSDRLLIDELRQYLAVRLPEYMVPSQFVLMSELPMTQSGKTDRRALPDPPKIRPQLRQEYIEPGTPTERKIEVIWTKLLNVDKVGINDNFFDIGGTSLTASTAITEIGQVFGISIPVVKLFQHPTIALIGQFIDKSDNSSELENIILKQSKVNRTSPIQNNNKVAVIGFAGRFPGAENINQLWENLCNGIESITRFTKEELDPQVEPWLRDHPDYVPARGIVTDADKFDAAFFGISPAEARVMDPQQRIFLELAWAALEHSGHSPSNYKGKIGVYAGAGDNHYYHLNVLPNKDIVRMVGKLVTSYGNEKDYIATRVSYQLNLNGPGVSLNTGCSTSLLAVDHAYNAIVNGECDLAIAGGADITVPQKSGQLFQIGGTFCKDGHCRPFDADATGTMFCDGAGAVILRNYDDALADGDTIYGLLIGTAKNNDGAKKISFLAPSVDGQAEVIALAQIRAGITPEEISYIETHGTGTPLGDPIEIEALTKAFRLKTDRKQFCCIGSVKGNIGHPTIASGIAGFIKTVLCLYYNKIPGTLHYKKPNPKIDFENSPFFISNQSVDWPENKGIRRAGVSSFGFGGTNVHVILEEAPLQDPSSIGRENNLLLFSAKTPSVLDNAIINFNRFLNTSQTPNISDISYTLACGRTHFNNRAFIVLDKNHELKELSNILIDSKTNRKLVESRNPQIGFMFPGQGSQYINMGRSIYDSEPTYRHEVDKCAEILQRYIDQDIRKVMFPDNDDKETAAISLKETRWTQPALFITGYALSRLFKSWGIEPSAMIGHSIGEFVCACISQVFSLEDALYLVAQRGKLMQSMLPGSMLSVAQPASQLECYVKNQVSIAAINAPSLCVLAGPEDEIKTIQAELEKNGIACKHLHTSHAFHSPMMEPIVGPFKKCFENIKLNAPKIPFVSTVSGTWITDSQATDPEYWARHLRQTVKFSDGLSVLLDDPSRILLETGPRATSVTLARQHTLHGKKQIILSTMGETGTPDKEVKSLFNTVGQLWLNGVDIDWDAFYAFEKRKRIALPTYPFERKRYWLDPPTLVNESINENISVQAPVPENSAISEQGEPIIHSSDKALPHNLCKKLFTILSETSERDLSDFDENTTFFEMGLDSLFLTQISFQINKHFGVSISFRQISEEYSTVASLAEWLEKNAHLQEEPTAVVYTKPQLAQPSVNNQSIGNTSIENQLSEQAAILKRILNILETREKISITSCDNAEHFEPKINMPVENKSSTPTLSMSPDTPPVPGARLGRDENGNPAWYIPDMKNPGKYLKMDN